MASVHTCTLVKNNSLSLAGFYIFSAYYFARVTIWNYFLRRIYMMWTKFLLKFYWISIDANVVFMNCHGRDKTKCYFFRSLVVVLIVKKIQIVFAGIIGRSLVQKIHKNINNLISSRLCTKLCWTDTKKTRTSCPLGKNTHAQKVPLDNH